MAMPRDEAIEVIEKAAKSPEDIWPRELFEAVRALEAELQSDSKTAVLDSDAADALAVGRKLLARIEEEKWGPFPGALGQIASGGMSPADPGMTPKEPEEERPQQLFHDPADFGPLLTEPGGEIVNPTEPPPGQGTGALVGFGALGAGVPERLPAEVRALRERFVEAGRRAGVPEADLFQLWGQAQFSTDAFGNQRPVEEVIEEYIANFEAQILGQQGDLIGPAAGINLPPGFVATRHEEAPAATGGLQLARERAGRAGPTRTADVAARWHEGDELSPQALSPERRAELQQQLVDAGLLAPDSFWPSEWDVESIKAYRTVLGYSNLWGTDVGDTISRLAASLPEAIRNQQTDAAAQEAVANAYVKPDYATLAQEVKRTFRNRLQREPTDRELAALAGQLGGFHRAEFDQVTSQMDQARQRVAETGQVPDEPLTFSGVDPISRFNELFDQRYGNEEQRLESIDDVRQNTSNVFASLRTMSSMIGS